jgi:hypothetical protein
MYFGTKNYLKSNRNHTAKYSPSPLIKLINFFNLKLGIFIFELF